MYVLAYFFLLLDPLDTDYELYVLIEIATIIFITIDRKCKLHVCNIPVYIHKNILHNHCH